MPTLPSESQTQDSIGKLLRVIENARLFAGVTSLTNYDLVENAFLASLQYHQDSAPVPGNALVPVRGAIDGILNSGQGALNALFATYAKVLDIPAAATGDAAAVRAALFDAFAASTQRVKSRVFTFGSPAAVGSPVGTFTPYRLTKDYGNFDIESGWPEAKLLTCVADRNSGAQIGEEVFELRGDPEAKDGVKRAGSGIVQRIAAMSSRGSQSYCNNPSFDQFSGTIAAPTDIPGWTSSVAVNSTNYAFDETNYYRTAPGVVTNRSLQVNVTATLSQTWKSKNLRWPVRTPVFVAVRYNREVGSGAGTLVLRWGNTTATVVLAAQAGWNTLKLALGTGLWFPNWNKNDGTIALEWTRTSGNLLLDDVTIAPMVPLDCGTGWLAIDGGATPALRGDAWSWTDSATDAGIIQYWLARWFKTYFPHSTGGGITWADPT